MVLGRPGAGCTTLLKTLANLREEYHSVEGDVFYDSTSPQDLKSHFRGDVQYCPEEDLHFPSLTVEQTISFAVNTRAPHWPLVRQTRNEYTKFMTDVLISIFGLNHCRKTPIGDAVIRGISGGEKKRVSLAEALALRSCITTWDKSVTNIPKFFGELVRLPSFFPKVQLEVLMQVPLSNSCAPCASPRIRSD